MAKGIVVAFLAVVIHGNGVISFSPATISYSAQLTVATRPKNTFPFSLSAIIQETVEPDPLSYAEQSRLYRRDFYTHESWLKHRDKNRFIGTIRKIFDSGVVRQLADEVLLVGLVATTVVVWNAVAVTGWADFGLVHHDPIIDVQLPMLTLPVQPFTLSSPALALLLVFKTNTSYARWDEARKAWGVIVNNSRTIARETGSWALSMDIPDDDKRRLLARIRDCLWLFPRTMQRHLLQPAEDTESYNAAVQSRLPVTLAKDMVNARHKPTRALYELSKAINVLELDTIRRTTIDAAVSQLCDAMGGCDRIFGSPVPSIYSRHAARFLELWIIALPCALYNSFDLCWNHWSLVPSCMILAFFLLGIEELAIQLEEPFSVLPLAKISGGIGLSADEHYQWFEDALEKKQVDRRNAILYQGSLEKPSWMT